MRRDGEHLAGFVRDFLERSTRTTLDIFEHVFGELPDAPFRAEVAVQGWRRGRDGWAWPWLAMVMVLVHSRVFIKQAVR